MNSATRRSFAKTLGLVGLVAVGIEGYKQAKERIVYKQDEIPSAELEQQLEGKSVLQLAATYGKPKYRNSFYLVGMEDYEEGTRKDVKVQIVPGPDSKLYVKENDSWRKI